MAYQFDGVSDYVEAPDNFSVGDRWAISWWAKSSHAITTTPVEVWGCSDSANNKLIDFQLIRENQGGTERNYARFVQRSEASVKTQMYWGTSGHPQFVDGNWHHYVIQQVGPVVELYIDGIRKPNATSNGTEGDNPGPVIGASIDLPMVIGGRNTTTGVDRFFPGEIAHWAQFETDLSETQITELQSHSPLDAPATQSVEDVRAPGIQIGTKQALNATTDGETYPGACTTHNGDMLVVYRTGVSSYLTTSGSHLAMQRSSDNGATWSAETTAIPAETNIDFRGGAKLLRLKEHNHIALVTATLLNGGNSTDNEVRLYISTDDGLTWGDKILVPYDAGASWGFAGGDFIEHAGKIMVPVEQRNVSPNNQSTSAVYSTHNYGESWTKVVVGSHLNGQYRLPSLTKRADGSLNCYMKAGSGECNYTVSTDDGATWGNIVDSTMTTGWGAPTAYDYHGTVFYGGADNDTDRLPSINVQSSSNTAWWDGDAFFDLGTSGDWRQGQLFVGSDGDLYFCYSEEIAVDARADVFVQRISSVRDIPYIHDNFNRTSSTEFGTTDGGGQVSGGGLVWLSGGGTPKTTTAEGGYGYNDNPTQGQNQVSGVVPGRVKFGRYTFTVSVGSWMVCAFGNQSTVGYGYGWQVVFSGTGWLLRRYDNSVYEDVVVGSFSWSSGVTYQVEAEWYPSGRIRAWIVGHEEDSLLEVVDPRGLDDEHWAVHVGLDDKSAGVCKVYDVSFRPLQNEHAPLSVTVPLRSNPPVDSNIEEWTVGGDPQLVDERPLWSEPRAYEAPLPTILKKRKRKLTSAWPNAHGMRFDFRDGQEDRGWIKDLGTGNRISNEGIHINGTQVCTLFDIPTVAGQTYPYINIRFRLDGEPGVALCLIGDGEQSSNTLSWYLGRTYQGDDWPEPGSFNGQLYTLVSDDGINWQHIANEPTSPFIYPNVWYEIACYITPDTIYHDGWPGQQRYSYAVQDGGIPGTVVPVTRPQGKMPSLGGLETGGAIAPNLIIGGLTYYKGSTYTSMYRSQVSRQQSHSGVVQRQAPAEPRDTRLWFPVGVEPVYEQVPDHLKPLNPNTINWGDPLTDTSLNRGLLFWAIAHENFGDNVHDLVTGTDSAFGRDTELGTNLTHTNGFDRFDGWRFDEATDFVTIDKDWELQGRTEFTVSYYTITYDPSSPGAGETQAMMAFRASSSSAETGISLQLAYNKDSEDGKLWTWIIDNDGVTQSSAVVQEIPANNESRLITITRTATTQKIFINGVLKDTATDLAGIDTSHLDEVWTLGNRLDNGDSSTNWRGRMDDVRVWDRALSDSEVAAVHDDSQNRNHLCLKRSIVQPPGYLQPETEEDTRPRIYTKSRSVLKKHNRGGASLKLGLWADAEISTGNELTDVLGYDTIQEGTGMALHNNVAGRRAWECSIDGCHKIFGKVFDLNFGNFTSFIWYHAASSYTDTTTNLNLFGHHYPAGNERGFNLSIAGTTTYGASNLGCPVVTLAHGYNPDTTPKKLWWLFKEGEDFRDPSKGWQMFGVRLSLTGLPEFILNGRIVTATPQTPVTWTNGTPIDSHTTLYYGSASPASASLGGEGSIGGAGVFNRTLSDREIWEHYIDPFKYVRAKKKKRLSPITPQQTAREVVIR